MANNKSTVTAETSDWVCSNCGAVLTGINNSELTVTAVPAVYRCPCTGVFIATRNAPVYRPAAAQRKNIGGGRSWPGG